MSSEPKKYPPVWGIALLLGVLALVVYWPARGFDFVNLDDDVYVSGNPEVLKGFSWDGLKWAFGNLDAGFWQPLVWVSYLLDVRLHGATAGGFHLTNLLLHAANTMLAFLALRRLTGAVWRSALVAALFAVHPLNVEAVVWISERKGLLSALFGWLTLMCYARFAKLKGSNSKNSYALALLCFAASLMSKPAWLMLPFVLAVLDYWPLQRFSTAVPLLPLRRAVLEKLPFLSLSFMVGLLTLHTEHRVGAVSSMADASLGMRLLNVLVSSGWYLWRTLCPTDLAVFYPYPKTILPLSVAGAVVLLTGVGWLAWRWRRTNPCWWVGCFWFALLLLPVNGVVQVGDHARADRYAYAPLAGLLLALVWAVAEIVARLRLDRKLVIGLAVFVVIFCAGLARAQLAFWRDSETLFRRALAVTQNNAPAWHSLGTHLFRMGRTGEAMECFRQVLLLAPDSPETLVNLGVALESAGQKDEAAELYRRVTIINPRVWEAFCGLGMIQTDRGKLVEAIGNLRMAVQLRPDQVEPRINLARALTASGQGDEALSQLEAARHIEPDNARVLSDLAAALMGKGEIGKAMELFAQKIQTTPDDVFAHYNLGVLLAQAGKVDEAMVQFRESIRLQPDNFDAFNNLAVALASQGKFAEALPHLETAVRLRPEYAEARRNLAVALAQLGRRSEAIAQLHEVLRVNPTDVDSKRRLHELDEE